MCCRKGKSPLQHEWVTNKCNREVKVLGWGQNIASPSHSIHSFAGNVPTIPLIQVLNRERWIHVLPMNRYIYPIASGIGWYQWIHLTFGWKVHPEVSFGSGSVVQASVRQPDKHQAKTVKTSASPRAILCKCQSSASPTGIKQEHREGTCGR